MADYNSSLPIRTESAGDAIVKVADATIPSQQLKVESDGSINVNAAFSPGTEVKITDGTDDMAVNGDGSINAVVSATNLDIRDLVFATDKVDASGSTLGANSGVDIGDVTINNAAGASAVNIQDGGNSITVDATNLDIRDLNFASDSVEVRQSTHDNLNLNANLQVGDADVANGNPVPVSDAGGSITVDANNLDIRDLAAATDSVSAWLKDESGNAFSNSNPLPVAMVDVEGTEVNDYNTSAALAAAASSNHDYTAASAFKLRSIWAAASGKLKIQVQIETAAASNTFNTVFVAFNSTANPNIEIPIRDAISVASGARVRIIRTNNDNQAQDVYSTISGFLV